MNNLFPQLPLPDHWEPEMVGEVWRVPYEERARDARAWAEKHAIPPASEDTYKIGLIAIDVQNTFCIPDFELYVAGRSGTGAVDDNRRLCEFIYRNLGRLTEITTTMDTHQALQIFHSAFLVNEQGNHPDPMTLVSAEDISNETWQFNPALSHGLGIQASYGQGYLEHYTQSLKEIKKYELTIWPYHAMLGGIGHALVSGVEEAIFFHSLARYSRSDFVLKGDNPLTEAYSAVGPEVTHDQRGGQISQRSTRLLNHVQRLDAVVIAGQAKSHCVAWTIADLLRDIQATDELLSERIYLLEDCTSPVVVPGVVDYSDQADEAFHRFARAGAHIVKSTDPMESWPGITIQRETRRGRRI